MSQFEGDLGRTALPEVMQQLAMRSQTGILTIQGEGDIVAISFLNGEIVAADALNQTVEEGLGNILVEQGLISRDELEQVGHDQQASGSSLTDQLLVEDVLSREQLLAALRLQTYGLLRRVLVWNHGEYKFYTGDEVAFEEGFAPISVDELLVRALEDSQGLSGHQVPDLKAVYRRVPSERTPLVLGRDGDGTSEGLWLTEAESMLLLRMDGQRSAMSIAKASDFSHYKAAYSLHRVLSLGLAEKVALPEEPGSHADLPRPPSGVFQRPVAEQLKTPSGVIERPSSSASIPRPAAAELRPPEPPAGGGGELPTLSNIALFPAETARPGPDPDPAVGLGDDSTLGLDSSGFGTLAGRMREPVESTAIAVWHGWFSGALALLLVAGVLLGLWERPIHLAFPAPWQAAERGAVERQLRQSQYLRIDRAARTFFLMDAHFPDSLEELVRLGLLSPRDLRDASGKLLSYSGEDVAYHIGPPAAGEQRERTETIDGDFHLDPSFAPTQASSRAPLFLID